MRKLTQGLVALVISTTLLGSCQKDNKPPPSPSKPINYHLAAVSKYCRTITKEFGSMTEHCQTKGLANKVCNEINQVYTKRLQDCEKKLRAYD